MKPFSKTNQNFHDCSPFQNSAIEKRITNKMTQRMKDEKNIYDLKNITQRTHKPSKVKHHIDQQFMKQIESQQMGLTAPNQPKITIVNSKDFNIRLVNNKSENKGYFIANQPDTFKERPETRGEGRCKTRTSESETNSMANRPQTAKGQRNSRDITELHFKDQFPVQVDNIEVAFKLTKNERKFIKQSKHPHKKQDKKKFETQSIDEEFLSMFAS